MLHTITFYPIKGIGFEVQPWDCTVSFVARLQEDPDTLCAALLNSVICYVSLQASLDQWVIDQVADKKSPLHQYH